MTRDQGAAAGGGRPRASRAAAARAGGAGPAVPRAGRALMRRARTARQSDGGRTRVADARTGAPGLAAPAAPTAQSSTTAIEPAARVRRVAGVRAPPPAADRRLPGRHRGRRRAWSSSPRCWSSASSTTASSPGTAALVIVLALAMAGVARRSARCSASSAAGSPRRIGEGLIYDLRTQVFDHVQRQSLAFFTRTQTGALVSPAQQRRDRRPAGVHLDAVQHRRPTRSPVVVVGIAMLALQLAGHPALPGCCSRCCSCVSRAGSAAGSPGSPASRWTATPTWATR